MQAISRMHSGTGVRSAAGMLGEFNAFPPRYTAIRDVDLGELVRWSVFIQRAGDLDLSLFPAEEMAERGHRSEPRGRTTDGTSVLSQRAGVGCSIDGGPHMRGTAPRCHPDAEAVLGAIGMLAPRDAALVLRVARTGERHAPWVPLTQRLRPVPTAAGAGRSNRVAVKSVWVDTPLRSELARQCIARGQPILDRHGRSILEREERGFTYRPAPDGKGRQVLQKWCPVEPFPSTAYIRSVNDAYGEWHAVMRRLLDVLRGVRLRDHRVTGFDASATPWDAE